MNPVASVVKHSISRTISVLCVLAVIALIGLGIKRILYPKPTESYQQKANNIINNETNYYPSKKVFGLGLTIFGFDVGISRYDFDKKIEEK